MKRLAITFGGAVSLGSFEAGVAYEILTALKQHNLNSGTPAEQQIHVDVLTGASASGMTAAIAAQKLLFDADALDGVTSNAFYVPWVCEVGLADLLAFGSDEPANLSAFSSDFIERIARRHLVGRYADGCILPAKLHPAAASNLMLGLAMSNLSGIDYSVPLAAGGQFTYTRFQDEMMVPLDTAVPAHDSGPTWERISDAAVACGAFPFAFRVKEVQRDSAEYLADGAAAVPPTEGRYAYTDGGTFQNEPLGLAKNLVDRLDPGHAAADTRHYLFVAPNLRDSVMDQGSFTAADASFATTAKRLVTAIFNQARYQDWVRVESVNDKVLRFDREAQQLLAALESGAVPPGSLSAADDTLLAVAYPAAADRQVAVDRLRQQFAREIAATSLAPVAVDAWVRALAVLEKMLGVDRYDVMRVHAVTASDRELAGSCLLYFGGFFEKRYREHDYRVGRLKAQRFISEINAGAPGGLGPIVYEPEPVPDDLADLRDVRPQDLSAPLRRSLLSQIRDRAHRTLAELGVNFAERQIVDEVVIKPKLVAFLGL